MNREFHYPWQFRLGGHFITGIAVVLLAAFALLDIADKSMQTSPWLLTSIAVLAAILISFGEWMAHVHTGGVLLTESEVIVQRRWRQKSINYSAISGIRHTHKAFRTLILQGDGKKLCINKNLLDYRVFYDTLRQKAIYLQKEKHTTLSFRSKAGETWLGAGIFMLLGAGICVGAWIGYFTESMSIWLLILPNIIIFPFIAAGFWWLFRYPTSYRFEKDCITVKSLAEAKTYLPYHITAVRYGQKWERIPRYGRRLVHFIEFSFDNDKRLNISDTGTAYPIEDITGFVKSVYGLEGKITEISTGKRNGGK